jgi:hypothetical protein
VRLIRLVSPLLTPSLRYLVEHIVLFYALVSLYLLVVLHTKYVNTSESAQSNCLYQELVKKNLTRNIADFDVIKIHISNHWLPEVNSHRHYFDTNLTCGSNNDCRVSDHSNSGKISNDILSSDELPSLFISDSAPRSEAHGRGGGSARLFSVAERLMTSPGPVSVVNPIVTPVVTGGEELNQPKISVDNLKTDILKSSGVRLSGVSMPKGEPSSNSNSTWTDVIASRLLEMSPQRIYLFSLEKGYLMLPPDERNRHDIRKLDITIDRDSVCFGPAHSAWLVHLFIGYDTVVMNWAISTFGGRGFLYNIYSKELFNLNSAADIMDNTGARVTTTASTEPELSKTVTKKATTLNKSKKDSVPESSDLRDDLVEDRNSRLLQRAFDCIWSSAQRIRGGRAVAFTFAGFRQFIAFKMGVIFSTIFLFFTTTTLVSFILRETQERMLKFTFLLQHHISNRIPYAPLVFTHAIESLVFVPIMVRL